MVDERRYTLLDDLPVVLLRANSLAEYVVFIVHVMGHSCEKIEDYSVAYFDHFAVFEALHH